MLKFYPDRPGPRFTMLLLDLSLLIWIALWIAAGRAVYRLVTGLWAVSDAITGTGRTFNSWIADFRNAVPRNVPFLGGYFSSAASALQKHTGDPLLQTGAQAHEAIQQAAVALALLTAAPPILIVGGLYLIRRWRQAREMGAVLAFVRAAERSGTVEQARALLAFRAVATLPFSRLMRASEDPVADLGSGRHERLAAEMLRSAGLESFRLQGGWPPRLEPGGAAPDASPPPAQALREARVVEPGSLESAGAREVRDPRQHQR